MAIWLVATLAWGALAFGAVYDWAYWPLLASCGALGLAGLWSGAPSPLPRGLIVGLVAVAAAALLQLVPVRTATLTAISPATDRLLRDYDLVYALGGLTDSDGRQSRHALSIRPRHTRLALSLFTGFSLLVIGGARLLERVRLEAVMRGLVALGGLVAFIGIVHEPFFNGRIYGFWKPVFEAVNPFGPFVNGHHFAGWMLMMLPLSLGYLVALAGTGRSDPRRAWRDRLLWLSSPEATEIVLVGFACVAMSVALAMTRSKSGVGGFLIAMLVAGSVVVRHQPTRTRRVAISAYLMALPVVAFGMVGLDAIAERFADMGKTSPWALSGRLDIWRVTAEIIRDFPLTGTGLNTFGAATLFYDPSAGTRHLAEAHNDYLQLAAEGGVLLIVPVIVCAGVFVREVGLKFRDTRSDDLLARSVRWGAVTALIAIGLQEIVEFSLQMPGNAALFCAACAIAIHHPHAQTVHREIRAIREK